MMPPHVFKKGDACQLIDLRGNAKAATVILASANGKSLAVQFDGFFSPLGGMGGFLQLMPLLWVDDHFEPFAPPGSSPESQAEASVSVKIEPR